MEDFSPTLKKLRKCIKHGFGPKEVAEVTGVVDEMKPDQTKAFRFPVTAQRQKSDLWLVIFMDDIDSPDLEVHACSEVIQKFQSVMEK